MGVGIGYWVIGKLLCGFGQFDGLLGVLFYFFGLVVFFYSLVEKCGLNIFLGVIFEVN